MLGIAHIQTGDKEPIETLLIDTSGARFTGATNIKCQIRRLSDDYYYDWNDDTFRPGGSVTQMLEVLSEVSATYSPGEYFLDTVTHVNGWDTSQITNPTTDDIYFVTLVEDGSSLAVNLPQYGELKVGHWVDHIDSDISNVQTTINSVKVDTTNIESTVNTINTKADSIISTQTLLMIGGDVCEVKQNYAYDIGTDSITGQIWVEKNNAITTPISTSVTWYDANGLPLFTISDSSPDTQGFFTVTKTNPGFVKNQSYYAVAVVTLPTLGPVISGKGVITVG